MVAFSQARAELPKKIEESLERARGQVRAMLDAGAKLTEASARDQELVLVSTQYLYAVALLADIELAPHPFDPRLALVMEAAGHNPKGMSFWRTTVGAVAAALGVTS